MGFADRIGRARVDPRRPSAFGVCDYAGEWRLLSDLKPQLEWNGTALVDTGLLVCDEHRDRPQPQLKAIRLPPDPVPKRRPRPEASLAINMPLGFQVYTLWPDGIPLNYVVVLTDGNGDPILDQNGQEIIIADDSSAISLLAQLAQITGIPIPGTIVSYNSTIATRAVAQQLVPANASRSWMAIINPCAAWIWISTGTAAPGVAPAIGLGPGDCAFWATAQGYGQPFTGVMTVAGNFAGLPYYAYGAPG